MLLRSIVVAFTLAVASISSAQAPSGPALADALRALDRALASHDRTAFEQLIAKDAVFFLPGTTHGADAVVNAWLPFLMPGLNTMTLTANAPVTSASGDLGYVSGSFAITGQDSGGPVVSARGEYVSVWRLLDGQWKMSAFGGAASAASSDAGRGAVAGYRFGMTQEEVRRVQDCQPYTNVSQTGGLECANFTFEGRRMNISFIFASDRLRRVQLWLYEGVSEADAKDAVGRAIEFLKRTAGGVSVGAMPGVEITTDRVMSTLNSGSTPVVQFDLSTPATSNPVVWFGRVVHHPGGYFVFLLADPRSGR